MAFIKNMVAAAVFLVFSLTACKDNGGLAIETTPALEKPADAPVQMIEIDESRAESEKNQAEQTVIVFPARMDELTEYNKAIFDIEPFELVMTLPDGWEIGEKDNADKKFPITGAWSSMGVYSENGVLAGAVAYNIYEEYEGAVEEPQAVYNQVALGNGYQFGAKPESGYKPIKETDSGVTAVTKVYISDSVGEVCGYGGEAETLGILSYNRELGVYIACEFAPELVSDEELKSIAESVEIRKHE